MAERGDIRARSLLFELKHKLCQSSEGRREKKVRKSGETNRAPCCRTLSVELQAWVQFFLAVDYGEDWGKLPLYLEWG